MVTLRQKKSTFEEVMVINPLQYGEKVNSPEKRNMPKKIIYLYVYFYLVSRVDPW